MAALDKCLAKYIKTADINKNTVKEARLYCEKEMGEKFEPKVFFTKCTGIMQKYAKAMEKKGKPIEVPKSVEPPKKRARVIKKESPQDTQKILKESIEFVLANHSSDVDSCIAKLELIGSLKINRDMLKASDSRSLFTLKDTSAAIKSGIKTLKVTIQNALKRN
eukprot:TRINITY_DN5204_c0_g1_i1.p1 TRINITY_DN5204_c0_g1~~TRINITY_DN5204_c0_g1_i1.p1  ORF type:complete len:174 (+),score=24.30 TRINITY_DN5204_c0_g1_i1:31-522(+)